MVAAKALEVDVTKWFTGLRFALFATALLANAALAQAPGDHLTTFFLGRVRYGQNAGRDCGDIGRAMARLVAQVSTVPVQNERGVLLRDSSIFETPFLFMNGHNDFTLGDAELANLRTYLDHGGFLFASGCCTNPAFPAAWRREFSRLYPNEKVSAIPYDRPIYRSFYRIERVRSQHRNVDVHLEGLFLNGRLVAVMCEDGLCCAFAMENRCNVGRGVPPEDARKLALNIAVYAMTH
jgi:hypothetical protein